MSDFAEAASAALSEFENAPAPTPEVVDKPIAAAPVPDPAPDPAKPSEVNTPDFKGTRHKVKVRGTEEEVDYEELTKGYSRTADYTRSKQELAAQIKQAQDLEASVKAEKDKYTQLFGDDPLLKTAQQVAEHYQVPFKQALEAVLKHQAAQNEPAPPSGQDQIATVEQATQIAKKEFAELQRQFKELEQTMRTGTAREIAAAKQEIVTSQQSEAYASEINTLLTDIYDKNPILNAVDNSQDILRFKVYQANPATVEEAKDLFVKFAGEQAEKLTKQFTELNKKKVEAKASLTTNGIEPPGGSGVGPQPTEHAFGSKGLRDSAEAYVRSLLG